MDDTTRTFLKILRQFSPWIDGPDESFPMHSEIHAIGLDSMTVVTLIFELESHFGISFEDAQLTYEVFRTPATIEQAVRTLCAR